MLEECGLPYNVIPIDIGAGDQFDAGIPEDLAQQQDAGHGRPRRPDGEPIAMFRSGAILIYLAENRQVPAADPRQRYACCSG